MKYIALFLLLIALPTYAQYNGAINLSSMNTPVSVSPVTGMFGYTIAVGSACNTSADCMGYYCFPDYDGIAVGSSTSNSTGWCGNPIITSCYHDTAEYVKNGAFCLTNTTYRKCSERTWETSTYSCSSGCSSNMTSCSSSSSNNSTNSNSGIGGNTTTKETKTFNTVGGSSLVLAYTQVTGPGVTQIEIKTYFNMVAIQLSLASASKPSGASDPVPSSDGKVYSYASIEKDGIADSEFSSIKIRFKVSVAWLNTSNVDPTKIYMYRYSGGTWNRLDTVVKSSDSNNYFYEATSPGFSTFAIGGYKSTVTVPVSTSSGGPSIAVVTPAASGVVVGRDVTVSLSVSGVTLADPKPNYVAGEGHVHVWLDGGQEQFGAKTTFTYINISEGNHTIKVELQTSNHSAFNPPVTITVPFAMTLTPPVTGQSSAASFAVGDFTMIGAVVAVIAAIVGGALFFKKRKKTTVQTGEKKRRFSLPRPKFPKMSFRKITIPVPSLRGPPASNAYSFSGNADHGTYTPDKVEQSAAAPAPETDEFTGS